MRGIIKKTAVVLAVATLAATGFGVAQAVTEPAVPTYTGCLATSGTNQGKLFAIAVGPSPTRSCTSAEKQVKLSSGDITSVAGGQAVKVTSTELGVPDTNGSVSLDLAPSYKLPQACTDGQLPKRTGGTWGCQSQLGGAFVGYTGDTYRQIGDDNSVLGDGMDLPAGAYTVVAKASIYGGVEAEHYFAQCRLDATGSQGIDTVSVFDDDNYGSGHVVLAGAVSKADAFRVSVVCHDSGAGTRWHQLRIVATPVNAFTNVDLGD
jgi:hypothetical protein